MNEFITYEMFGAVGDGKADDMPAIVQAHEEANRLHLPVRAREGAVYYISPAARTATVHTCVDWTGAKFIVDDRGCENRVLPLFHVTSELQPLSLDVQSLSAGQTKLANPHGRDLFVIVKNANQLDYIRRGLNQNDGTPRTDCFILRADGTLSSALSFDFEEVTSIEVYPMDDQEITLTGGEFTTIANQAESRYNYHCRNILIERSHVEVSGLTHLVTGEMDHGAPYDGFVSVCRCAEVFVHDCLFTGHLIYETIGSAGLPVSMGTYDINLEIAASITLSRCSQTNDIHDKRYWGLICSNFCRDLLLEDCVFSRFDAHMGVSNCTLRRCKLGWQCLNAIGNGTFLIEDVDSYGYAFVNLRSDYGSTWNGSIILRNYTWHPLIKQRAVFAAHNDGTHYFGYDCHLPEVDIDGLTVIEEEKDDRPLSIFNNYPGKEEIPEEERRFKIIPPETVRAKNITTHRPVCLCENPNLLSDTKFDC